MITEARPRPNTYAAVAVLLAALLPIIYLPLVAGEFWMPKFALLPLAVLFGVPALIVALRTGPRGAAAAAIAFGGWACLATALSQQPAQSVWGYYLFGTGLIFTLALPAAWALGLMSGAAGRTLISRALLATAAVNAVLALIETLVNMSSVDLGPFDGRAIGLWGNPVWMGAFAAGGAWLGCTLLEDRRLLVGFTVISAAAVQVSGARSALGLLGVVVVMALLRDGPRRAFLVAASIVGGVLVGLAIVTAGSHTSATGRVVGNAEGLRPRLETWLSALHAIARHPLTGAGPGRYQAAVSHLRTLQLASTRERIYEDAHNFVVEYATTTGIVGVALLGTWLLLALRRAGLLSALGGFALLVGAAHLVEPQNVGLTPIALLALGAASPAEPGAFPGRRFAAPVLAAAGTAIAAWLLIASGILQSSINSRSVGQGRQAADLLPPWPDVDEAVANAIQNRPVHTAQEAVPLLRQARPWVDAARADDPMGPIPWLLLGAADTAIGDTGRARAELLEGLRLDPWAPEAFNALAQLDEVTGDKADEISWLRKSLQVVPGQTTVRARLGQLGG